MKITAVDFETANSSPASICAVGVSAMDDDGAIEDKYYSLIRPEDNVNRFYPGNIRVHHITPDMVKNAPSFAEIYPDLKDLFDQSIICAHNARFDMTCLKEACLNSGRPVPYLEYFDTVVLSRHAFSELKHHRLNNMADYLGIDLNHHQASSDAHGCLMIVAACMNLSGIYDIRRMLKYYDVKIQEL